MNDALKGTSSIHALGRYRRVCWVTLLTTYLLIFVGASVRSLDAGMGCPDWPKCYGAWVPPLSASDLPSDYQAQHVLARQKKNARVARMFRAVGLHQLATQLTTDELVRKATVFDPTKAWIEYINRLVGVVLGLLILLCLGLVLWLRHPMRGGLLRWSVVATIAIIVQGLLGALVVSTHLLPFVVSWHMFFTFVLLIALHMMYWKSHHRRKQHGLVGRARYVALALAGLSVGALLVQMLLGSGVRERIDRSMLEGVPLVLAQVETIGVHRSLSWLVFALWVAMVWWLQTNAARPFMQTVAKTGLALCVLQMLVGMGLYYADLPFWLKPLHLWFAFSLFACGFYLVYTSATRTQIQPKIQPN